MAQKKKLSAAEQARAMFQQVQQKAIKPLGQAVGNVGNFVRQDFQRLPAVQAVNTVRSGIQSPQFQDFASRAVNTRAIPISSFAPMNPLGRVIPQNLQPKVSYNDSLNFAKSMTVEPIARFGGSLRLTAEGRNQAMPTSPVQKFVYGNAPVKSFPQQSRDVSSFLQNPQVNLPIVGQRQILPKLNQDQARIAAPLAVAGLAYMDLTPVGPGKAKKAVKLDKALQAFENSIKASGFVNDISKGKMTYKELNKWIDTVKKLPVSSTNDVYTNEAIKIANFIDNVRRGVISNKPAGLGLSVDVVKGKKNVAEQFNKNLARTNISFLVKKTNLQKFTKSAKGSPNKFAYVEDLDPNVANQYSAAIKTVIGEDRISHLQKRPALFKQVLEIMPTAIKEPDDVIRNPNRANSFILMKQNGKNFGVAVEIDRVGDHNFIRTVQPMPERTVRSYQQKLKQQSGRPAIPPSIPELPQTRQPSGNIVSDVQSADNIITQNVKLDDSMFKNDTMATRPVRADISSEAVVTKKGSVRITDIPTQTEIKNRAEVNAGRPDLYSQRKEYWNQSTPTDQTLPTVSEIAQSRRQLQARESGRAPQASPNGAAKSTETGAQIKSEQLQTQPHKNMQELPKESPAHKLDTARVRAQSSNKGNPTYSSVEEIIENSGSDVKKKVGALDYLRTPDRVLAKIGLGNESQALRRQYDKYLKELPQEVNKITEWSKRVPKESNQKIFKYLDGQQIELNPTEKKVAEEIKVYFKEWADKLGLPEDRRITNYITHIFDEELLKKEFDPDIARLIRDKVAGSVYDPFVMERLGKMGYVEDTWAALDAYVKRGTRKYNLDPILKVIKDKAEGMEDSQFRYVKQYIDRVNMRPTAADNLLDNTIKQFAGYKYGQRPVARLTRAMRQAGYRGTLGLNVGSALRNLSQGSNTYAKLGEKYTVKGYWDMLTKGKKELEDVGVLRDDFVQDRTMNATKKFWEKLDKGLFVFFDAAERVNRGAAYYGAKAKAISQGKSEQEAVEYAKKIVRDTQFVFGSVDTPAILQSDLVKTVGQFQSYNMKQAEFLAEMVKNKEFAGLVRYSVASMAFVWGVGRLIGMKPEEAIPFSGVAKGETKIGQTPAFQAIGKGREAVFAQKDKYGNDLSLKDRADLLWEAATPLLPGGVQAKKTIQGINAARKGYSESASGRVQYAVPQDPITVARAATFGKSKLAQAKEYFDKDRSPLGEKQTQAFKLLPAGERQDFVKLVNDSRKLKRDIEDKTEKKSAPIIEDIYNEILANEGELPEEVKVELRDKLEKKVKAKVKKAMLRKQASNIEDFLKLTSGKSPIGKKVFLQELQSSGLLNKDVLEALAQ